MNREIGIIIAFDESTSDEEKIKNSIESAIAQGKESMEIILAADSVSEKTKELLSKYAESNDRIKVLYT